MNHGTLEQQVNVLSAAPGFCTLPDRTQVELSGGDRHKFLQGLCTNDVVNLQTSFGSEAFLTNVQGKTAGYVYVFCSPDRLLLDTVPGQAETILSGLDRYLIREDVVLQDRTGDNCHLLVAGAGAADRLQQTFGCPPFSRPLQHAAVEYGGVELSIRSVPFGGAGSFFLSVPGQQLGAIGDSLPAAGFERLADEVAEVLRIEAGSPCFGVDLTAENLPQEVGRDQQAISFNKGCYLGQETVARLDALGHVNRLLVCLRFNGDQVPGTAAIIEVAGKPVARITSACWSPLLNAPLALAYVRRSHMPIGSRFTSEFGEVEVVAPPRAAV